MSFTYFSRFPLAELVDLLRKYAAAGDDDNARKCLSNIIDKSPKTLESALAQDDSFVGRHSGHHKAGRARDVKLSGDVVSFSVERHPGTDVVDQRWSLDLTTLAMSLEIDDESLLSGVKEGAVCRDCFRPIADDDEQGQGLSRFRCRSCRDDDLDENRGGQS